MTDFKKKSEILSQGFVDTLRKCRNCLYKVEVLGYDENSDKLSMPYQSAKETLAFLFENCPDEMSEAEKIEKSRKKRQNRLNGKIRNMLEEDVLLQEFFETKNCAFCTFTFKDEVLEKTSKETRRQYIRKLLKEFSGDIGSYVANVDYGKNTQREHYHALIFCPGLDGVQLKKMAEKFGYAKIEFIRKGSNSLALSHYINKLTNHAIKNTAEGNRIIYSRKLSL